MPSASNSNRYQDLMHYFYWRSLINLIFSTIWTHISFCYFDFRDKSKNHAVLTFQDRKVSNNYLDYFV